MNKDGLKYDDDKPRWDLLHLSTVEEAVKVLTYGAKKYGPNNWQGLANGVDRYFAAVMRHLSAWQAGELIDPESGLPHLAHALTSLLFVIELSQGEDKNVQGA
jgi:hypothetical protein